MQWFDLLLADWNSLLLQVVGRCATHPVPTELP